MFITCWWSTVKMRKIQIPPSFCFSSTLRKAVPAEVSGSSPIWKTTRSTHSSPVSRPEQLATTKQMINTPAAVLQDAISSFRNRFSQNKHHDVCWMPPGTSMSTLLTLWRSETMPNHGLIALLLTSIINNDLTEINLAGWVTPRQPQSRWEDTLSGLKSDELRVRK